MKKIRTKISIFFAYIIIAILVISSAYGIFFGFSSSDDYENALKILSNSEMGKLENYTGKVAITGVLTFDPDTSVPESDQYLYLQKRTFIRTVKKNEYTNRNEVYWTSTTEAPVYGKNIKINGLAIDPATIVNFECHDYGLTTISESKQNQIFGIKGNHVPVTILGAMEKGKFVYIPIISINTNMKQVIASLSGEDSTIISYSNDFIGLKFLMIINAAIIMYFLLSYVFIHPIFDTLNKKHIAIVLTILIAILYEITSNEIIGSSIEIILLILLLLRIKDNILAAISCWISVVGLYNGLTNPIVMLPARFLTKTDFESSAYQMIAHSVIFTICIITYFVSKNWRKTVSAEMEGRSLVFWQKTLAFFVGLLMFLFYLFLYMRIEVFLDISEVDSSLLAIASIWIGLLSLVLSATVIAVITNASRQFYYHHKVSDMQFNIIVMMAEIVENRDANTGGHIQRTAQYVEIIARELKKEGLFPEILTDKYIDNIKLAATLHDIGKIHVSDVILNKEGNLTDEEFAIMKSHAEEGRKLLLHAKEHLGDFEYLNLAADMAGYHHEWWDGSEKGYPEHLKEEEIPLCARIMAVADVFDALTSRRIYKNPMPLEKAYLLICEQNGTHFDPTVIQAFCNARLEIKYTMDKLFKEV